MRSRAQVRRGGALLLICAALSACSGGGAASTSPSGTPRVAATATVPADPYPAQDTPFDSLSPSMKRLWGDYGLTVVPGRAVEAVPQAPPFANMTDGHVSGSDATLMVQALMRRNRLVQWAVGARQWDFLTWLGESDGQGTPVFSGAQRQDEALHLPDCFVVPQRLSLWWAADMRDIVVIYQHVQTYFALQFQAPCAFTAEAPGGGTTTVGGFSAPTVWLVCGYIFDDPVLGAVWRGYVTPCSATTSHAAQCAVA